MKTFQLMVKITDTYFHIVQLFVSVLYKGHIETWHGIGKDVFPKTYSYSVLYVGRSKSNASHLFPWKLQ
jgi:hypothetical protein